jgi:hypothetical protein
MVPCIECWGLFVPISSAEYVLNGCTSTIPSHGNVAPNGLYGGEHCKRVRLTHTLPLWAHLLRGSTSLRHVNKVPYSRKSLIETPLWCSWLSRSTVNVICYRKVTGSIPVEGRYSFANHYFWSIMLYKSGTSGFNV